MEIDINRVSAFLAWNFPPYYEQYSKMKFMKILLQEASSIFPEKEEFDFIDKHSSSLQVFFKESLSLIEDKIVLENIIIKLKVPFDAKSKYEEKIDEIKDKKDFLKTIWLISPFDERWTTIKDLLNWITSNLWFNVLEVKMHKESNWHFLWDSIKEFLNKYEIYVVDLRNQNLNVAIELWYILAKEKQCIVLTDQELPSDIRGFKYIKPEKIEYTAWDAELDTEEINSNFKSNLSKAVIAEIEYLKSKI